MAKKHARTPRRQPSPSRTDERTQYERQAFARCLVLAKSLRARFTAMTDHDQARIIDFVTNGTLVPDVED